MTNDDIFAKSSTIKGAIFDQNNIIEVIDTLDYVNYSFRFVFPETPLGTFYNLVVTKTPTGEKNEPFIIKFTCKDSYLEAFLESDLDFNFFYGNYKIHKYTDYFTRGYFFKSNPDCPEKHDENGDPIPCEKEDISGGSSGGDSENEESTDGYNSGDNSNGNSNDSNSGDSDSSDGSDSGDSDSSDGDNSSNSDDSGGSSYGNDHRCAWVDNGVIYFNPDCHHNEEKFNQTKNNDDCPDCPEPIGGIGINIFAKIVQEINHYLDNSLSNSELAFLSETKNLALATKIRDFILENNKSQEAIEFAKSAIDALKDGKEVDFDDQIINELTNKCAKTIFKDIREEGKPDDLKPEVTIPNGEIRTFSGMILDLFSNLTINYTIQNGSLSGANGRTTTESGGVITTISNDYLGNATTLSIARTMIHESVHAYLLYQNSSLNFDFRLAIENYGKENGFNINGTNGEAARFHHEFMGQYVDAMAYSLYTWDKNYGNRGNLGWDYYRSMAFGGLFYVDSDGNIIETDSFKALVPNSNDRQIIKEILENEQNGNSKAKGKKCN